MVTTFHPLGRTFLSQKFDTWKFSGAKDCQTALCSIKDHSKIQAVLSRLQCSLLLCMHYLERVWVLPLDPDLVWPQNSDCYCWLLRQRKNMKGDKSTHMHTRCTHTRTYTHTRSPIKEVMHSAAGFGLSWPHFRSWKRLEMKKAPLRSSPSNSSSAWMHLVVTTTQWTRSKRGNIQN